jgi:hypothetical protein
VMWLRMEVGHGEKTGELVAESMAGIEGREAGTWTWLWITKERP